MPFAPEGDVGSDEGDGGVGVMERRYLTREKVKTTCPKCRGKGGKDIWISDYMKLGGGYYKTVKCPHCKVKCPHCKGEGYIAVWEDRLQ